MTDPGWSPGMLDIGQAAVGGHVVDLRPPLPDPSKTQLALMPEGERVTIDAEPNSTVAWTIGFHHDRAAQIETITWVDPPKSDPATQFESVTVEVSSESPIGPWTSLGEFTIERDSGGVATFTLDDRTWARFIRFTGSVPAAEEGVSVVRRELPDQIQVAEAPADGGYRSILGEWGTYQSTATHERQVEPEPITLDADAGNDAASATILAPGDTVTNSAAFGTDEDWYRIAVPPGDGLLTLDLTGIPALGVTATLFDDAGTEIAVDMTTTSADSLHLEAGVHPGESYLLRVTQPPTSVVCAFDTSGSVGSLVQIIYQGLTRFAADVLPAREFVNIVPFGEGRLLDEWSDQSYLLQSAIAAYPRTSSSSSSEAEEAILIANEGLAAFSGTRAIILITDAESGPTYEIRETLSPSLTAVAPRIFAVGIAGSSNPQLGQDLLQDWSSVNSGHYVYVRDQGEMDIAFDRAATELRRPSIYTILAETSAPEPTPTPQPTPLPVPTPEPTATPAADGSLQVLAPQLVAGQPPVIPAVADGQVAIILDTSGSMLQGLDDSTRADIARTALVDLVTTTIPAGTTVSLRTFGDTPDSCETLLVVPPQPLDGVSMSEVITTLPIVNLVRTPIGASLEAVAGDLGTGDGPQIVVLVTDGEETCGGDAAAAIQALVESGIDVRVNIVGFAIDDTQLAATFAEWASVGNGQYIDAGNAGELNRAVSQAVLPTFDVVDASGSVVASGQVGAGLIALPPGTYRVIIDSDPANVLDVVIESGVTTEADVPAP